jgi:hypothetical protein
MYLARVVSEGMIIRIHNCEIRQWNPAPDAARDDALLRALEGGAVVHLPRLGFEVAAPERRFLSGDWSGDGAKNVSLRPGSQVARGARGGPAELASLGAMMLRYADGAEGLVDALLPRYRGGRSRGNTSFRPAAIETAPRSWRSDDRRLHADSFASNPMHGRRILRVFTNVHPGAERREWEVGEPFAQYARRFFPRVKPPLPGGARVLAALGITKSRRSAYDHYMLGMHDAAKADMRYQREAPREAMSFAPGDTWIVFTDQVVHAAMRGQYALEQTFYVDVDRMQDRGSSPLAVLEGLAGRSLA